jgi:hypothetical protein
MASTSSSSQVPLQQQVADDTQSVSQVASVPTLSAAVATTSEDAMKVAQWKVLTDKFDETRMRKHNWEYGTAYMPLYRFQPISRISDIWTEWSTGLNGYLPVRNLNEQWGARWRRGNRSQGTENCRRARVVELINKLVAKPGWDLALALRFLLERYEGTTTPRKFCDYIQKEDGVGFREVLQAALAYPPP